MSYLDQLRPRPGLRVLVTAGASGIGAVMVEAFLEAGAKVHICDIDEAALARFGEAHPGVGTTLADVADEAAVAALFAAAEGSLGGLDILVNNAGIAGPTGRIDTLSTDDIRRTLDIDLLGQFLVARLAVPHLLQSEGLMINIASVAGRLGYALRTPYAASKWGIVGFTKSLAVELGPQGVRVNVILPGVVRGPRIESVISSRAEAEGVSYAEMEKRYLDKVSLRRMVGPEDVATTALFLASPGGANISGQAISVCGNVETL